MTGPAKTSLGVGCSLLVLVGYLGVRTQLSRPLNTGFECGWRGGALGWRPHGGGQVSRSHPGYEGSSALLVSHSTPAGATWATQTIRRVEPGATYQLRVRCASGTQSSRPIHVGAKVQFWTSDGRGLGLAHAEARLGPDDGWQQLECKALADPRAQRASLVLRVFGEGTADFDDVGLTRVHKPGIVLLTDEIHAKPGAGQSVALPFWSARRTRADHSVRVTVRGWAGVIGEPLDCRLTTTGGQAASLRIPLPRLSPGAYVVDGIVTTLPADANREFRADVVVPMPEEERRTPSLREGAILDHAGKPFFPIGLYHVPVECYSMVAKQGFNTVQGILDTDSDRAATQIRPATQVRPATVTERTRSAADAGAVGSTSSRPVPEWCHAGPSTLGELRARLDAAHQAGLMVALPLYGAGLQNDLERMKQIVRTFDSHPAVLSFKLKGEPSRDELPWMAHVYRELKALYPCRPIELCLHLPSLHGPYAPWCDTMVVDPYPLPDKPLTMVSAHCACAQRSLQPWQGLVAALQAGWQSGRWNQPTLEQAREMVRLALANGATGLYWYAFRDPGWGLEETPLWGQFPELNALAHATGSGALDDSLMPAR